MRARFSGHMTRLCSVDRPVAGRQAFRTGRRTTGRLGLQGIAEARDFWQNADRESGSQDKPAAVG